MFVGHFAGGVALKAAFPEVSTLAIIGGVSLIDFLSGLFGLVGWDKISSNLNAGPYLFFNLDFVDWDHSVLMASIWAVLWGWYYSSKDGTKAGMVAFIAAISHFLEDWLVHNNDLALYPYSEEHIGLSLWQKWGIWSWVFEGVFTLVLTGWATSQFNSRGISNFRVNVLLALIWVQTSPWTSPLYWVAQFEEPYNELTFSAMIVVSFGIGVYLLTHFIEGAEKKAKLLGSKKL